MNATLPRIRALFNAIDATLFTINPVFDYDRTIEALTLLARMVHEFDASDDGYELRSIDRNASLDSLLIGAYWFLTDYHGGQNSSEYACLCAIGEVFNPGMTAGPEPDSMEESAYHALEILCPHSDRTEF